jgi:hypothetical protein
MNSRFSLMKRIVYVTVYVNEMFNIFWAGNFHDFFPKCKFRTTLAKNDPKINSSETIGLLKPPFYLKNEVDLITCMSYFYFS